MRCLPPVANEKSNGLCIRVYEFIFRFVHDNTSLLVNIALNVSNGLTDPQEFDSDGLYFDCFFEEVGFSNDFRKCKSKKYSTVTQRFFHILYYYEIVIKFTFQDYKYIYDIMSVAWYSDRGRI